MKGFKSEGESNSIQSLKCPVGRLLIRIRFLCAQLLCAKFATNQFGNYYLQLLYTLFPRCWKGFSVIYLHLPLQSWLIKCLALGDIVPSKKSWLTINKQKIMIFLGFKNVCLFFTLTFHSNKIPLAEEMFECSQK